MKPVLLIAVLLSVQSPLLQAQGYALRFFGNGINQIDRIKVPIDSPARPADVGGDFTVEFWMKGTSAANGGTVSAAANGDGWITGNVMMDRDVFGNGDNGDWGISVAQNGRIAFGVDRGGSGRTIVSASGNALDNTWHHVAVTRQSATGAMAIYLDGVRVATGTGPAGDLSYRDGRSTSWPQSDPFLVFGAEKHDAAVFYGGSYPSYSGWLDEVRISNVVRYTTATFSRPSAPFLPDSSTAALWHFDEGTGDSVSDQSNATGGPSNGVRAFGGAPAGPLWSADSPFSTAVLVDMGHSDFPTTSPDAGQRHWNNFLTDSVSAPGGSLTNLLNTNGLPTGLNLSVASFGAGANTNGTTVPDPGALGALSAATATRDGFYVASGNTATVTIQGLTPGDLFRFTLFGSRDATETRVTRVTAQGSGAPLTATVQTSGSGIGLSPEPDANRTFTAVLEKLRPTPAGTVVVSVTAESGAFAYLGALWLEPLGPAGNSPPTAAAVEWEGAPRVGASLQGRYTFADADGDAESGSLIQWERSPTGTGSGTPISGATTLNYPVSPSDADRYLRLIVTPAAASGQSPGTPQPSAWRGPVGEADAQTLFHVGNSFTRWGDVPAQLAAFASERGQPHVRGDQIRDGEDLAYHWANGLPGGVLTRGTPSRNELATGTWDILVLQPKSREFLPSNFGAFLSNAELFDDLCDANGTRLYLYLYWPYLSEPVDTQDAINAAFESVRIALSADGPEVRVIPVGEAFRRVAQEVAAGTLSGITREGLYRDDLHPSDIGYYLASLVHYATIYRESPEGLPATGINSDPQDDSAVPIPEILAAQLQRIAWEVTRSLPNSGVTRGRFDAWAAANLPQDSRDPDDIPFLDTITNLARWAFDIPPTGRSGNGFLPTVTDGAPGQVTIVYRVNADAEDAGLIFEEQWSTDLTTWTSTPPSTLQRGRNGAEVTLRFEESVTPFFFRCRIRLP